MSFSVQGRRRLGTQARLVASATIFAFCLGVESLPSAQGPGVVWLADDVADVNLGASNCTRYPRVNGFGFGPDGAPMVGWTQVEGCGGSNETHWSEKLPGGWNRHTWDYGGFWSGPNGSAHEFALGDDGRPYLFMVGGNGNSLTYHTYRADLRAYADGAPGALVSTGEHVGNHQECIYVRYRPVSGPGQAWPYRVTARGRCDNSGPFRFEGQDLTGEQIVRGFDLAMDANGRAHIAFIDVTGRVLYMRPGGAAVQVATVNSYSDEVAIQPGADGALHIVVRGFNHAADYDRGRVGYLQSVDDGATWTFVDYVDQSHQSYGLSLQLDATGAPAVAFWRYSQGLYYSSRASGQWVESRVAQPGFSGVEWVKPPVLRFDAAGVPHVAYYDWTANRIRVASPWAGGEPGAAPPVDLRVAGNASPNPSVAGTQVTYTLTVTNDAAREASGVRVGVTLPVGATVTSPDPSPLSNTAGVVTFDAWRVRGGGVGRDRLAAGATGTITFNLSGLPTGTSGLSVTVTGAEEDANPADNSTVVATRINEAMCALPASGRTAWWPGDGTSLNYGSGSAYHATPVGGVSYGPGAVGQAFVLDGATGYLKVPNAWPEYYWPDTGATSVAAWFATKAGAATQVIASMDDMAYAPCCGSPQGWAAWYLYVENGVVKAAMRQSPYGSASVTITGTTPVADGQFHHAALVMDIPALQVRLYVNGALEASAPLPSGWAMSWGDYEAEELVIGASQVTWGTGYRSFFNGALDDVALYKRALTAAEIANAAMGPSLVECGAPVPDPPQVDHPGDQQNDEGDTVTLPLTWSAGEGKTVGFTAKGLPPGLAIDPVTGTIGGTLTTESAGAYTVMVTISDGERDASVSFGWVVRDVNRPPVVAAPLPDLTLLEDALPVVVDLEGVFADPDGVDGLTYTASSDNPAVLATSVDTVARIVMLTLAPDAFGVAAVTVVASDGALTAKQPFLVTVTPVNDPPRVDRPADVRVAAGREVVVPLTGLAAGAPNEVGQILNVTGASSSATVTGVVSATLGDLRFTPPARGDVAVATVTVEVADNGGTADGGLDRATRTFTVTVVPPPSLAAPGVQSDVTGGTVSLPISFTAYPDAPLDFTATGLPPGLSIDRDTGVIAGTLGTAAGTYTVTVTLDDGMSKSSISFTWQVVPAIVEITVDEHITVIETLEVRPAVMLTIDETITVTDDVAVVPPVLIAIDEIIVVTDSVETQAANTPAGSNTTVVFGGGSSKSVMLRFASVTAPGQTSVQQVESAPPVPSAYVMPDPPLIYDISTTAQFTGVVEVCVEYGPAGFQSTDQRLLHHDGTSWVDTTTSNRRDTATVCGTTTHFSPFAVVEPAPLDGRITGNGRVDTADAVHEFYLHLSEGLRRARPNDRLRYEVTTTERVTSPGKSAGKGRAAPPKARKATRTDRFEAAAVPSVYFYDAPGFGPGMPKGQPTAGLTADSVVLTGVGTWNGASGYTFEARAADRGEPGKGRDRFAITILSPQGEVMATVDGTITAGNIQSHRVGKR